MINCLFFKLFSAVPGISVLWSQCSDCRFCTIACAFAVYSIYLADQYFSKWFYTWMTLQICITWNSVHQSLFIHTIFSFHFSVIISNTKILVTKKNKKKQSTIPKIDYYVSQDFHNGNWEFFFQENSIHFKSMLY